MSGLDQNNGVPIGDLAENASDTAQDFSLDKLQFLPSHISFKLFENEQGFSLQAGSSLYNGLSPEVFAQWELGDHGNSFIQVGVLDLQLGDTTDFQTDSMTVLNISGLPILDKFDDHLKIKNDQIGLRYTKDGMNFAGGHGKITLTAAVSDEGEPFFATGAALGKEMGHWYVISVAEIANVDGDNRFDLSTSALRDLSDVFNRQSVLIGKTNITYDLSDPSSPFLVTGQGALDMQLGEEGWTSNLSSLFKASANSDGNYEVSAALLRDFTFVRAGPEIEYDNDSGTSVGFVFKSNPFN